LICTFDVAATQVTGTSGLPRTTSIPCPSFDQIAKVPIPRISTAAAASGNPIRQRPLLSGALAASLMLASNPTGTATSPIARRLASRNFRCSPTLLAASGLAPTYARTRSFAAAFSSPSA
jgi:hypothetical protein